jgi:hypothetical protein
MPTGGQRPITPGSGSGVLASVGLSELAGIIRDDEQGKTISYIPIHAASLFHNRIGVKTKLENIAVPVLPFAALIVSAM